MPTDRTRPSDDLRQGYRGVRFQQGRVVLDRDLNAGEEITAAEFRFVGLHVVGPVGTPDDGYKISAATAKDAKPLDFKVAGGTLFVGGVRISLANSTTTYFNQLDWLTPDPPDALDGQVWNEFVYLCVTEAEVSAREDPDLSDVGLGGPDSAGRSRMLARVGRMRVAAADCKAAFLEAQAKWAAQGFSYNEPTALLLPQGKLLVEFDITKGKTNLCQPEAVGGYLHPDNQCIRVKRTKADELIWGFDNASFLYRIDDKTLPIGNTTTLTITPPPPDATRYPKAGQVIEVLRSVAKLPHTGHIAEADGFVTKLATDYDAGSSKVTLAAAPNLTYQNETNPLYLRVWESPVGADGTLVAVSDPPGPTGVTVTLSGGGPAVGSYWIFAPRPETPQSVYPERLVKAPQIPDGPRDWVAPLAFLQWDALGKIADTKISDCRPKFDNLVELTARPTTVAGGGCCTITIGPDDVSEPGALKKLMEPYRQANAQRLTVCFRPGTYPLHEPIIVDKAFKGLTLHGCGRAILTAHSKAAVHTFLDGLVVVAGCPDVTVSGLQFNPRGEPVLTAFTERKVPANLIAQLKQLYPSAQSAVAIRAVNATHLTVEGCEFTFPTPNDGIVFGAGVFTHGDCTGFRLTECRFDQPREAALTDPNAGAKGALSRDNLKQIARAIHDCTDDAKRPPKALGDLLPYTEFDPAIFVHPSVPKELPTKKDEMPAWVNKNSDYVYVPFAAKGDLIQSRVLVYEKVLPGMTRVNAALGDGSVRALAFDLARELVAKSGGQFVGVATLPTERGWFGVLAWHVREATDKAQVTSYTFRPVLDAVTVADNDFVGVSLPVLALGDIGTVAIRDNRGADCTGGVWLSTPDYFQTLLQFPETKLGITVAEAFPADIKGLDPVAAKQLVDVPARPLDFAVRIADNHFDGRPASSVVSTPAVAILGDLPPFFPNTMTVATLSTTRVTYKAGARFAADRQTVTLTGNNLAGAARFGNASWPTVLIAFVDGAAMTGNIIENTDLPIEKARQQTLLLVPRGSTVDAGDRVSVTGNVFRGATNLDNLPRSNKKPLWTDYNSEIS